MAVYAFGSFVLDTAERWLTRDGRRVAVPGKAWQILLLLAEARGRLVPHETLRARLWPDIVVEERTLTVHVSTLRKSLGPGPGGGYIETVSREGYRLAVPVRLVSDTDRVSPVIDNSPPIELRTLAVKPFATRTLVDADSYLGVGIADAVSTALGAVPGLTVWPIDDMENVAGAPDTTEACRALGVKHLLEGVVLRSAERLEISARLIDVESGRTQWSERFEQAHGNSVALQDAVASWAAATLPRAQAVDRPVQSYRPRTAEAYFLQLQARANLKPFTRLPLLKALSLFEQAVAIDPDYAMAHAGLASTYLHMSSTALLRPLPVDEAMPMARRSAERALALDEGLAEAWAVLGRVKMEYDWDWDGAEADLTHALALNASSVEALAAGEPSRALDALEHCVKARTTYPGFTGQSPCFRTLHGDPRFQEILRALRLEGRIGITQGAAGG